MVYEESKLYCYLPEEISDYEIESILNCGELLDYLFVDKASGVIGKSIASTNNYYYSYRFNYALNDENVDTYDIEKEFYGAV